MEDQLRTNLNGGELVRSTFVVLTFARALTFVVSCILVFVFAFLPPLGAKSLSFCFATVKKEVSRASAESPPKTFWSNLCLCTWRFVEKGCLSSVQ